MGPVEDGAEEPVEPSGAPPSTDCRLRRANTELELASWCECTAAVEGGALPPSTFLSRSSRNRSATRRVLVRKACTSQRAGAVGVGVAGRQQEREGSNGVMDRIPHPMVVHVNCHAHLQRQRSHTLHVSRKRSGKETAP